MSLYISYNIIFTYVPNTMTQMRYQYSKKRPHLRALYQPFAVNYQDDISFNPHVPLSTHQCHSHRCPFPLVDFWRLSSEPEQKHKRSMMIMMIDGRPVNWPVTPLHFVLRPWAARRVCFGSVQEVVPAVPEPIEVLRLGEMLHLRGEMKFAYNVVPPFTIAFSWWT